MAQNAPEPPSAGEAFWRGPAKEAAKQALGTLLTGAGLLGFVAFAGAVIVWTRFEAIDVPPDQAVKAVPRDELVASGASLLLIFGFFGALAVLATYLVDRGGRATPGMSRVLLGLVAAEGIAAIALTGQLSLLTVGIGIGFLALVGVAIVSTFSESFAIYSDTLKPRKAETEPPLRGGNSVFDRDGEPRFSLWWPVVALVLVSLLGLLIAGWVLGDLGSALRVVVVVLLLCAFGLGIWLGFQARASRDEDEETPKKTPTEQPKHSPRPVEDTRTERQRLCKRRPHRLELTPRGVVLLLLLAGVSVVVPAAMLHHWWLAVSFGAAFVLSAGVWRVAVLSKPGFFWYALVVFVSVPLFGTLALMARNVEDPQVQPMAMIRSTDGPGESIQGIYVTEAEDRVYFANVATKGCTTEIVEDSGRLLWVPRKEVVAMSVGPLQDIEDTGRSALEMAYALTPGVETPSGALFGVEEGEDGEAGEESGAPGPTGADEGSAPAAAPAAESDAAEGDENGEGEEGDGGEEEDPTDEHRLESAGPAVRRSFGRGLRLVPEQAEPGEVVELRMSAPENGGFGSRPEGYDLRLGGVRLQILRIPAQHAERAEYVETTDGEVLRLRWQPAKVAEDPVLRLRKVGGVTAADGSYRLALDGDELAAASDGAPPTVLLPNGETKELKPVPLRRAWSPTGIKFRVPQGAESGVVSVECGQLAGQPALTVVEPPVARLAVEMRPGTARVRLDSSRSAPGVLTRRWTVGGRSFEGGKAVSAALRERLAPHEVALTVTGAHGLADTVELSLLRLPASRFPLGDENPASRRDVRKVRTALKSSVAEGAPRAIELAGHADAVGDESFNAELSLKRVRNLRNLLFERLRNDGAPVPLLLRAFGESCPVVPSPGPQQVNRRVEVFLLGPGAVVRPRPPCRSARTVRMSW